MTFTGTESLDKADEAARRLRTAAQGAKEVIDNIASVAGLVGCTEYGSHCVDQAGEAIDLVTSVQVLLERKREELYLASLGMTATAASMAEETDALAMKLQGELRGLGDSEQDAYDEERVQAIVEQLEAVDPNDQDSIDELTAELQFELERKTGNYDDASRVADLMLGGAEVEDAIAYVAAGDDYQARVEVLDKANDHEALAIAIVPTLDIADGADLALATVLLHHIDNGAEGLGARPPIGFPDSSGPPTPQELLNLISWLETADGAMGLRSHDQAMILLDRIRDGIDLRATELKVDLLTAVESGLSEDGDVDVAIAALMQYASRDGSKGGIEFNAELLEAIGLDVGEAEAMYTAVLQIQLMEFDDYPDRAEVKDILIDYYISFLHMDEDEAMSKAANVEQAVADLTQNYELFRSLNGALSTHYDGDNYIEPEMIDLYIVALNDPGGEVPPYDHTADLPEDEMKAWRLRDTLRVNASHEGVGLDEYLARVRADMTRIADENDLTLDELEAKLRNIQANRSDAFKLIGAGQSGTALLKLETAEDFSKLDEPVQIDESGKQAFLLGLYGRSFLSLDDITEIDKKKNGEIDQTLSIEDLSAWLPDSGLPIAVQDVLLASANYGGIDLGVADRLRNWSTNIALAITAIGAMAIPIAGTAVGTGIMTAGGILGGVTAAGVAVYKNEWGNAAFEGVFAVLDVIDGPTQLASMGVLARSRMLKNLLDDFPASKLRALAKFFPPGHLDAIVKGGKINATSLDEIVAAAKELGGNDPLVLETLRMMSFNVTLPNSNTTFHLSATGFQKIVDGNGDEVLRLARDWKTLKGDDAWQLYTYTTLAPTIDRATLISRTKNGFRYDPSINQLRRVDGTDRTGRQLRKNLEDHNRPSPGEAWEAHHIVAINHPEAAETKKMLKEYGIDINDEANGVWLPKSEADAQKLGLPNFTPHNTLHTDEYYKAVNRRLGRARAEAIAEYGSGNHQQIEKALKEELREIQSDLTNGTMF